jgi:ATP-dependent helicase HrpB
LARWLSAMGDRGDAGALIARAFPERIALRRAGDAPRYLLSGGKGARLADDDALAGQRLLAVADIDGADGREAVIRLAAPLAASELEDLFGNVIEWRDVCEWSRRERKVIARRRRMLGALVLEDQMWRDAPPEAVAAGMAEGVRDLGIAALPWSAAARRVQARAVWARAGGASAPDLSDDGLLAHLDDWLTPHLVGMSTVGDLSRLDMAGLLKDALGWEGAQAVDGAAPSHFVAPTGTKAPIDYSGAAPSAAIRLQELFGLDAHPIVAGAPLLLELLSPAGRPVQMTADLPGFWRSSYVDVRKDMRGRYPRHPWPEDPANATPTRRVKPRVT